jgi:hypothetical protein
MSCTIAFGCPPVVGARQRLFDRFFICQNGRGSDGPPVPMKIICHCCAASSSLHGAEMTVVESMAFSQ